mmetsp:Transcript_73438/g.212702  ORF Transcript_73438/g.212702 Transcript_73438/m.212702 type:complete len:744 (-) Transcript_73438:87-2318(-)
MRAHTSPNDSGGSSAPSSSGEVHPGRHRAPAAKDQHHHKKLNRQITAAADSGDFEHLLRVIDVNLAGMNLINLSTAVHRAAKLALVCSLRDREHYMNHPCMCSLKRALVDNITTSISPTGVWTRQRSTEERSSEMRCLSIICWSCATIRFREESFFKRVAVGSRGRLQEMKPFELSNLLWSFAKLSIGGEDFFGAVAPHLLKRPHGSFSPQCLATIAWAFGTAKVHNHALFSSFARELASAAPMMATQGIANTAWAFARVRRQEASLFRALAEAACREHILVAFKPQELSNVVWAFATVGLPSRPLFSHLADILVSRCWELPPQNVANMLWAYAKLSAPCRERVFPPLLQVTMSRLDQYKPQEISAILWAAAREIACGGEGGSNVADYRALFRAVPMHFWHRLQDFTSQALACMVEAFTLAEVDWLPFFEHVVRESLRRLDSFEPPSLCTLIRGLMLHLRQHPDVGCARTSDHVEALSEHILARIRAMQPHNLAHLARSLDLLPPNFSTDATSRLRRALPGSVASGCATPLPRNQQQPATQADEPQTTQTLRPPPADDMLIDPMLGGDLLDDEDDNDNGDILDVPAPERGRRTIDHDARRPQAQMPESPWYVQAASGDGPARMHSDTDLLALGPPGFEHPYALDALCAARADAFASEPPRLGSHNWNCWGPPFSGWPPPDAARNSRQGNLDMDELRRIWGLPLPALSATTVSPQEPAWVGDRSGTVVGAAPALGATWPSAWSF